jgi:hypothetical protein
MFGANRGPQRRLLEAGNLVQTSPVLAAKTLSTEKTIKMFSLPSVCFLNFFAVWTFGVPHPVQI